MEQWWGLRTCVSTRPAQLPECKQEYRRISSTVVGILPWRISRSACARGGICRGSPAGSGCSTSGSVHDPAYSTRCSSRGRCCRLPCCNSRAPPLVRLKRIAIFPSPSPRLLLMLCAPARPVLGSAPKQPSAIIEVYFQPAVRGRWLDCCPIQGRVWGEEDGPSPIR